MPGGKTALALDRQTDTVTLELRKSWIPGIGIDIRIFHIDKLHNIKVTQKQSKKYEWEGIALEVQFYARDIHNCGM